MKISSPKKIVVYTASLLALAVAGIILWMNYAPSKVLLDSSTPLAASSHTTSPTSTISSSPTPGVTPPTITFVGIRQNIPKDAPIQYGFWSFAESVPGVLSRSGQPLLSEFQWLKNKGWKGNVDLRTDGEYNSIGDDSKIPGFTALEFHYLYLPIIDGHAPTDDQARQFLAFATNPENQPVHVHCRGGYGRAGTMIALYRYSAQHWPMNKAIDESRLFHGGVSPAQTTWLLNWANRFPL